MLPSILNFPIHNMARASSNLDWPCSYLKPLVNIGHHRAKILQFHFSTFRVKSTSSWTLHVTSAGVSNLHTTWLRWQPTTNYQTKLWIFWNQNETFRWGWYSCHRTCITWLQFWMFRACEVLSSIILNFTLNLKYVFTYHLHMPQVKVCSRCMSAVLHQP